MDPTVEALAIYPAAWAALFQGLADGLAYGLAIVASLLVLTVVLAACLGGNDASERPAAAAPAPVVAPTANGVLAGTVPYRAPGELDGVVRLVWGPRRPRATRRRRRPRCTLPSALASTSAPGSAPAGRRPAP